VHTYDAPPKPPEKESSGYSIFKKKTAIFFTHYGVKDSLGREIIPPEYDGFVKESDNGLIIATDGPVDFSDGFVVAKNNGNGYIYLDKKHEKLIPFIRNKEGRMLVHGKRGIEKIGLFQNGLAFAQFWGYDDTPRKIIMNTSGRCLSDRTWDKVYVQCGNLIPVYSQKDGGCTFLLRDGRVFDSYYKHVYVTLTGVVFASNDENEYFCLIPFGKSEISPLRWQHIKQAEPGLLWTWRDGRHELIDCRENRTDFLSLYAIPGKTQTCWTARDGLFVLTEQGGDIHMTDNEFKAYLHHLEKNCGLSRVQSHPDGKNYRFRFEGGRIHAPLTVQAGNEQKTCSLVIDFRKTDTGFVIFPIAAGKPLPPVSPVQDLKDERVHIDEDTLSLIGNWHSAHWGEPFCDYTQIDLSEYVPPHDESDDYPYDTTRV